MKIEIESRALAGYTRWVIRRRGTILAIALLSLAPMGWFAARLFGDVRADLKELLPEGARSVKTLRRLERRFGGWSELAIVVESPDRDANRRFGDDLVRELSRLDRLRSVADRVGPEREFFARRRWLFLDTADLEEIVRRIARAVANANPMMVDLDDAPAPLDLSDLEAKYRARLAAVEQFPDGWFENPNGTRLAVVARKRGFAFDISENRQLVAAVEQAIARLEP